VLIYGAYRLSGYSSLMLWLCFFTASLLIAGYTHCSLYSGNSKTALLGSSDDLVVRDRWLCNSTQMIGFLLLVVELLMLHLGQTRNRRWFLDYDRCLPFGLTATALFLRALRLLPAWKEVYSDNVYAIFIRSAPSSPRGPSLDSGF